MNLNKKRWIAALLICLAICGAAVFGIAEKNKTAENEIDTAELTTDVEEPEPEPEPEPELITVDVFVFAGQSNMAGQGIAEEAPEVAEGSAYEFRAVTDPTRLYPIEEPFGIEENREEGIYDIWPDGKRRKSGDLVPAFVNKYCELTQHVVVAVSASECATTIDQWLPETGKYEDLASRVTAVYDFLAPNPDTFQIDNRLFESEMLEKDRTSENGDVPRIYTLGNVYLIWCQGESDGDRHLPKEDYYASLEQLINAITEETPIEQVMVIRIGNNRDYPKLYDDVMAAQTELCRNSDKAVLISTEMSHLRDMKQMKDIYHYTQAGYDRVGTDAGENLAAYVLTGEEPTLWDYETDYIYVPENDS